MAEEQPRIGYMPAVREAGLSDEERQLVERLVGSENPEEDDQFGFAMRMVAICQSIQFGRVKLDDVRELLRLRAEVEQEIRQAFAGVTREGGESWSEAAVIDDGGTEEQCAAARASDTESSWEELVDGPDWNTAYTAAFSFLDAIGFRYYLAPAMIRDLRDGLPVMLPEALEFRSDDDELRHLLSSEQHAAIENYLRYLLEMQNRLWTDGWDTEELRGLLAKWRVPRKT